MLASITKSERVPEFGSLAFRIENVLISSDNLSKSDFLFDVVIFQNRDATSLTELHGNLIAGLETISRNGMS